MLKRLLERLRHLHLLRLLLIFNGMVTAILAAVYYTQGSKLWGARLYVKVGTEYTRRIQCEVAVGMRSHGIMGIRKHAITQKCKETMTWQKVGDRSWMPI